MDKKNGEAESIHKTQKHTKTFSVLHYMDVAVYVLVYGNYISKVKKTAKKPKNKVKYNIHDLMMVNDEGVTHGTNGI